MFTKPYQTIYNIFNYILKLLTSFQTLFFEYEPFNILFLDSQKCEKWRTTIYEKPSIPTPLYPDGEIRKKKQNNNNPTKECAKPIFQKRYSFFRKSFHLPFLPEPFTAAIFANPAEVYICTFSPMLRGENPFCGDNTDPTMGSM